MIDPKKLFSALAAFAFLVAMAVPAAAASLESPEQVKTALLLLVQVSNDMKMQITSANYARVPHENMEFADAGDGLRSAVAREPADLKRAVELKLKVAVEAAQHVADMSDGKDQKKLLEAHGKVVTALNGLFTVFPADVRPDPNAQPRRQAPPPGAQ
jgi:hypothetical protein